MIDESSRDFVVTECSKDDIRNAHDMLKELRAEGINVSLTDILIARLLNNLDCNGLNISETLSEMQDTLSRLG